MPNTHGQPAANAEPVADAKPTPTVDPIAPAQQPQLEETKEASGGDAIQADAANQVTK